jgi:hypothetical protein
MLSEFVLVCRGLSDLVQTQTVASRSAIPSELYGTHTNCQGHGQVSTPGALDANTKLSDTFTRSSCFASNKQMSSSRVFQDPSGASSPPQITQ